MFDFIAFLKLKLFNSILFCSIVNGTCNLWKIYVLSIDIGTYLVFYISRQGYFLLFLRRYIRLKSRTEIALGQGIKLEYYFCNGLVLICLTFVCFKKAVKKA